MFSVIVSFGLFIAIIIIIGCVLILLLLLWQMKIVFILQSRISVQAIGQYWLNKESNSASI